MKIGDTYIHTVTNTRLRVEEVMETPTGPTVYFKAEGNGMNGYAKERGYYPFPVNYVEKQIKMEDGTFKRG
ncbi:hypothetical protein [Alistipes shahii]|uniref:hypothetical protein n=1 Tax=Alistipes shahii TaxID=328814 RepID=UPI003CE8B8E0